MDVGVGENREVQSTLHCSKDERNSVIFGCNVKCISHCESA